MALDYYTQGVPGTSPQGPPPPYPAGATPTQTKRFKGELETTPAAPPARMPLYLTQQQLQVLQVLQQNSANLTPPQQVILFYFLKIS